MPNETRHFICNTCGADFRGLSIPTRKKLLSSVCGEVIADSLQTGSFLVASRSNSERPVSTNFPALVAALFKLKRAHWKYGVYFIFSFGIPNVDDVEGDSKVFALNLTRLMDGSRDHPIPDEVLHQQQVLKEREAQEEEMKEEEVEKEQKKDLKKKSSFRRFPRVVIKHHNGGPVKWSSYRAGMFVVEKEAQYVEEQLRRRGFESDGDAASRSGDPAAVFLSTFLLIPLVESSCLVVGKFSLVMEMVQALRYMFADGSEVVVFSFSGYAEWTKAQLLREVARGSWGVVAPQTALIACEELINPSIAAYPTAHLPPSLEELSGVAKVASSSVGQSCNASDEIATTEEKESKVMLALQHDSDDDDDDDVLPPIPPAVRSTTGSISRARSASNPAASAASASASCCDDMKDVEIDGGQVDAAKVSSSTISMWRETFSDIEEENIWRKMIEISIESGDNIIRQSYTNNTT